MRRGLLRMGGIGLEGGGVDVGAAHDGEHHLAATAIRHHAQRVARRHPTAASVVDDVVVRPGPRFSADTHSRPSRCIDRVDLDVADNTMGSLFR